MSNPQQTTREVIEQLVEALDHCMDAITERGLNGSPDQAEKWGLQLPLERAYAALAAGQQALEQTQGEAVDIDALCARIKAADDACADMDYMLDSNDCISVLRGTWRGPLLNDMPPHPQASAVAWDEGYTAGVNDERISESNIGVAGFGAKVNPARENPYRRTHPQATEPAPTGINGLTQAETDATMSVRGLSEPAPSTTGEAERLYDAIKECLLNHRLQSFMGEDEEHYPLVDHLTHGNSLADGQHEIALICDSIYNTVLKPATPPQVEPAPKPPEQGDTHHWPQQGEPAPSPEVLQALTDPENQPNQFGVVFGMHGPRMFFAIGNQSFDLAYEPDEPEEFEFMKRMLCSAFSTFTPDVKTVPAPSTAGERAQVVEDLLMYAGDNGYSHIDYADTMRHAAALLSAPALPVPSDSDDLIKALADVRDLFPIPERGSKLEHAWMEAVAFPESVPAYVRACIAPAAMPVGELPEPFHPRASHINPDYRDGWNAALAAARSQP